MFKIPFEITKQVIQSEIRELNEAAADPINSFRKNRLENQLQRKVDGLMQLTVLQHRISNNKKTLTEVGQYESKGENPSAKLRRKIDDLNTQYLLARTKVQFAIEDL